MTENEISYKIIGACIDLHKNPGPGLLESVYENALACDLREMGFSVAKQVSLPVVYREIRLEAGFRTDIIVENKVLVELKSIELLVPVHFAQTLTYVKLSGPRLGLLINFNTVKVADGIHRIVNKL